MGNQGRNFLRKEMPNSWNRFCPFRHSNSRRRRSVLSLLSLAGTAAPDKSNDVLPGSGLAAVELNTLALNPVVAPGFCQWATKTRIFEKGGSNPWNPFCRFKHSKSRRGWSEASLQSSVFTAAKKTNDVIYLAPGWPPCSSLPWHSARRGRSL